MRTEIMGLTKSFGRGLTCYMAAEPEDMPPLWKNTMVKTLLANFWPPGAGLTGSGSRNYNLPKVTATELQNGLFHIKVGLRFGCVLGR